MGFGRTLRAVGGTVIAGALVFASAPVATADQTREDQWALKAFDAEAIWKVSKGKGVIVAVIDSGVNADHVDLKGNVIEGKDFIDGGSTAPDTSDSKAAHGTEMASVIAGHGHGSSSADGVMGLAPEAKILDIRDNGADEDGLGDSIRYAVDHGASVINISMEGGTTDAEPKAVAYALQHDVLVVAGSGNDGEEAGYPASYPGVLGVGGVQNDGTIWEGSNYGSSVLLSAPATNIVAAGIKSNTAYRSGTGTSDSTAYVSAAAALLRAKFPDLTAGQIANRLTKTAGLPSSAKGLTLPDKHYGYGYIQPLAALTKDIPAGSKYGPLTVPTSLQGNESASASPQSGTSDDASASSSSSDSGSPLLWIGLGIVGVLVLVLVIVLIVKASRRNNNRGGGPGGPGGGAPGTYGPGPAPQGYSPYPPSQQNPYQQPPQGQWQGQGQGQWPNQQ
jgi:type VII secretion-associated serine protease mycosin